MKRITEVIGDSIAESNWITRIKLRHGMIYGIFAGLAFSITAWGIDGFLLHQSNSILPWMKLALGGVPCIVWGAFVGWLTTKLDRGLVYVALWALTGVIFGWLAGHIPFQGTTALIGLLRPDLLRMVSYPFNGGAQARMVLTLIVTGGISLLTGSFLSFFVDASSKASVVFGRWMPLVLWVALFAGAGSVADSTITQQLRTPVTVIDELVQFTLDHEGVLIDNEQALEMHLGALGSVKDLMHRPRRLVLSKYDITLVMVDVLIDFDGVWVTCSVHDSQPGYCKRIH